MIYNSSAHIHCFVCLKWCQPVVYAKVSELCSMMLRLLQSLLLCQYITHNGNNIFEKTIWLFQCEKLAHWKWNILLLLQYVRNPNLTHCIEPKQEKKISFTAFFKFFLSFLQCSSDITLHTIILNFIVFGILLSFSFVIIIFFKYIVCTSCAKLNKRSMFDFVYAVKLRQTQTREWFASFFGFFIVGTEKREKL